MNYKFLYLLICILGLHSLTAQQHQVIDSKGTQITVTSSQVSTTSTAPSNPNEGDVWIDTASNTIKIWEEGTVPAWKEIASIRNWIPSSQNGSYLVNHLVSYEGALYKNLTGTNSVTTPDLDTTNWAALEGEGNAVPLWKLLTNGGSYVNNDVINYNGMLYKSLTGTNSVTTPDLDTTNWAVLLNTSISDADGDTKIEVEQTADEDIIRFTTAGTERLKLDGSRIIPTNSNFSVFIGENAGTDTVSSSNNNVFIGRNVGSSITTGNGNVALGTNALVNNDVGINNTALGISSLQSNQNGTGLVAVGVRALQSNTNGIQNTALGKDALGANTTGAYNIGIGPDAGRYIANGSTPRETGANSIYIGKDTKASVDGTRNEIVIGTNVTGKGDNTITLGNGAGSELYTAADIISKRFHTIWKSNENIYAIDDIVIYNGIFYKNLTGNNTAVAPDADTTNWFPNRGNVSTFTLLNNQLISVNQTFEVESTELLGSGVDWAPNGDFTLTPGTYELIAEVLIDFHDNASGVLHFTFTDVTNARFPASYEGTAVMNNSNRAYGSVPARAFITITANTTVRLGCTATASGWPNRGRIKSDNGQSRIIIKKIN